MNKRNRQRMARRTFKSLAETCPEMKQYYDERQLEIIAYLETVYQDWDNPYQEAVQRRC